jgi:hypothetical protein
MCKPQQLERNVKCVSSNSNNTQFVLEIERLWNRATRKMYKQTNVMQCSIQSTGYEDLH